MTRRNALRYLMQTVCAAVVGLGLVAPAPAQEYPTKAIKVVVPWGAGGTVDVVSRIVAQRLSHALSQPVVVENRTGANGMIGMTAVARSAPDGYTLVISNTETNSLNPHVFTRPTYDPIKDFVPVAPLVTNPLLIAAKAGIAAATLDDAVQLARSQPGKFTFGSWGIGSVPHLCFLALMAQTGTDMLHVPYKSGPDSYAALVAGQIDFMVMPVGIAAEFKRSGKIKVLAVSTERRSPMMEDVPTLREQGYPVELRSSFGILAPAGTPEPVLRTLSSSIGRIVTLPDVEKLLKAQGTEPAVMSRDQYSDYLKEELKYWGAIARKYKVIIKQ